MNHEELIAARLLCNNPELSVIETEQMLENILRADDADPEDAGDADEASRSRGLFHFPSILMTGLAAVAVLALFVKQPWADEFTARSGASGPRLDVICEPGPACSPGAGLAFRISDVAAAQYVVAFARAADGTVIWYLPEPGSETGTRIVDGQWLPLGVRLGVEHPAGDYPVRAFVSAEPLTRKDVKRFVEAGEGSGITELTATFTVQP